MLKKHLKHFGSTVLGTSVVFFSIIFLTHTQTQPELTVVVETLYAQPLVSTPQETLTDFQKSSFYRTIVDNNLFRPLGWRPPRPREPYRLLGTIMPTNENRPKQAILQRTTARTTHIATIGEKLDADTTLIDIQPKQVTLETSGQQRTLRLNTAP